MQQSNMTTSSWLHGEWVVTSPALRVVGEEDDLCAQGKQGLVEQLVLQHRLKEREEQRGNITTCLVC